MKILLTAINSKYIHSNLAVYSLKAFSKKYSDGIKIREFTINNLKETILREIYMEHPDVLCFSVYIWNLEYVTDISREFHKLCPDVPIWVGGPEVSFECEEFLKEHSWITGIMAGEGEETFSEVSGYYFEKIPKSLGSITGIFFWDNGKIVSTGVRNPIDMDTIPFSYSEEDDFSNRIVYYESSRGCPFSCSYCLSSVEKKLRFKSFDKVKEELDFFLLKKAKQVKFVDRTFNCDHKHAIGIWRYISDHDNGVTNFHFEVSADLLTEEEIELIGSMRPGLIQLEIGVQSVNESTIKEIHRTMNLERLKEVVKRIQAFGNVHEHVDLIAGLPYEDISSFINSFNEIYALKADQLQLGFLKVLKGSYMYEHAKEYGLFYKDNPPYEVMATKWISFEDILRLKRVEEMVEVYYNSGQFTTSLKLLETLFETPFEMFDCLGRYYEEQGLMDISHNRLKRYEILLDFMRAEKIGKEEMDVIREAMVFDVYERENAKTRPAFSDDCSEWKDISKERCTKGKLTHLERFHYVFPSKQERTVSCLPVRQSEPQYILFDYCKKSET